AAAGAVDDAGMPQDAHKLRNVRRGQALRGSDLRQRRRLLRRSRQAHQTTQTVLFLSCDLHGLLQASNFIVRMLTFSSRLRQTNKECPKYFREKWLLQNS